MPTTPRMAASIRIIVMICRPFMPSDARMPISRMRSKTDMSSVLAMTTATTSMTMASRMT